MRYLPFLGALSLAVALGAAPLDAATSTTAREADQAKFLADAAAAQAKGDIVGAAQLLQSAIITLPTVPGPYDRLAQLYADAGESALARKYFAIALDIEPTNAIALKGMALLNLAAGDRDGAVAERDLLRQACGTSCPETAQVEKALSGGAPSVTQ
jgi:Flp pilus assembly protein TadD